MTLVEFLRTRFGGSVRRAWFQDEDGTYFRNCPLIMRERTRAVSPRHRRALSEEWWQAFREGLIRADTIGRNDVIVKMRSFREAYPDHPGLWRLDDA